MALVSWLTTKIDKRTETPVYRTAAERALLGEQFYRPDEPPCFTYPPLMVLPYAPLTWLPERPARAIWCMANLCMLAGIVWLTLGLMREEMDPLDITPGGSLQTWRRWLMIGLLALLSTRYELTELAYQGHDFLVFLLAMLVITSWAHGARLRMGAFAGLAAAAKATPLLFLPVFLWQRQWRAAATMVLVGVAATLLPDVLVPNREGGLWVQSWYSKFISQVNVGAAANLTGSWSSWNELNQSLPGTLYRLFTRIETVPGWRTDVSLVDLIPEVLKRLTIAGELAVLGLLLFCTWPRPRTGATEGEERLTILGQGGAVLCGMLLLSPMSSVQHFCLLLPPLAFCCVDFFYRRRNPWVGTGLAVLLCNGISGRDIIGPRLHVQLQAYGHMTWITLLILVMCGYIVHCRCREAHESAAAPALAQRTPRWRRGIRAACRSRLPSGT